MILLQSIKPFWFTANDFNIKALNQTINEENDFVCTMKYTAFMHIKKTFLIQP